MIKNSYPLPVLLFDSECTLCARFKESLLKLSGSEEISFVPIYEENVYQQYPQLSIERCQQELHFIDLDGEVFSGSEAIQHLSKQFPAVSKFAWLIESNMGKRSIDYFYKMADSYRKSLLNRCSTCK